MHPRSVFADEVGRRSRDREIVGQHTLVAEGDRPNLLLHARQLTQQHVELLGHGHYAQA